jgi:ATP-dependent Lhr-like helicase
MAGEQFALPEAVGALREVRRRPRDGEYVTLNATDPLNLTALVTPGARVPAQAKLRLLYRNGVPVATLDGRDIDWLAELAGDERFTASQALLRTTPPLPARH